MESYCTVAECESPTRQGRIRCDFHEKRHQRGQTLTAPKQERLSPKDRLLEAAFRLAESDSENDAEYERNARALLRAARRLAPQASGEVVRRGMAEARTRGVRLGRPPEVTAEQAAEAVRTMGSIAAAARALGASRPAIYRALGRVTKGGISLHSTG